MHRKGLGKLLIVWTRLSFNRPRKKRAIEEPKGGTKRFKVTHIYQQIHNVVHLVLFIRLIKVDELGVTLSSNYPWGHRLYSLGITINSLTMLRIF